MEDIFYRRTCSTGGCVLLDQMSYCRIIISGGHVLLEDFFHDLFIHTFIYLSVCVSVHLLHRLCLVWEDMFYCRRCLIYIFIYYIWYTQLKYQRGNFSL